MFWTVGFRATALISGLIAAAAIAQDEKKPGQENQAELQATAGGETKASTPEQPAKTAKQIVAEAVDRASRYSSIQADMTQAITMGSRTYSAKSSYVQGPDYQLRIEMEIFPIRSIRRSTAAKSKGGEKAGRSDEPEAVSTVLHICDGRVLWTQQTGQNGKSQTRRQDVREILKALKDDSRFTPDKLTADLGLGGVPALLTSMQNRMIFTGVRRDEIDGKAFLVVQGQWKPEQLAIMMRGKEVDDDPVLPPFLPEYARVYFEEETLFPRRIIYLKRHKETQRKVARPMVTLDFRNVKLNGQVDADQFRFTGSDSKSQQDVTAQVIQMLKAQTKTPPGTGAATDPAKK